MSSISTPTIRVPDSLAELDQWVMWRNEQRNGGNSHGWLDYVMERDSVPRSKPATVPAKNLVINAKGRRLAWRFKALEWETGTL